MIIRSATPADAKAIAHVHVEAWRSAYKDLLPADFLASLSIETRQERWMEILTSTETNQFTFVAEINGTVIGFSNGGPERNHDPVYVGEIYAIYLLDEYRRQGIGSRLVRESVDFLLEHRLHSMRIWVLRDNPHRLFYERHGGQVVEEKPITIGGTTLIETAYGWINLEPL